LFDVAQIRTVRYPLPEGNITAATAAAFQVANKGEIKARRDGISPMHMAIKGHPDRVDMTKTTTMRKQLADLAAFQTKVRAVRLAGRADRMRKAQELVEPSPPETYTKALALLLLLRDSVHEAADWTIVLDFVRKLPDRFASELEIQEIRAFAGAQAGDSVQAIAELEKLIELSGATPERFGLIGGRHKRLGNLEKAIEAYAQGMELDLNAYYCSSNLPRLYRKRASPGDEERAQTALQLTIVACQRAIKLKFADEWVRLTQLGTAFDRADAEEAEQLVNVILADDPARWKSDAC
jgi:tetratricopeptide (TPR) repeat protein